jgi:hypothetical protein
MSFGVITVNRVRTPEPMKIEIRADFDISPSMCNVSERTERVWASVGIDRSAIGVKRC